MPAYVRVNPGDPMQAAQLNQVIDSLTGAVGKGVPLAVTAVNDASNYALALQNDDATNSRALLVQKQDGTTLIQADVNGVVLALANGSVHNAALASDVARANLLTNGGFEVWSRGVGPFTANGSYTADRWIAVLGAGDTISVSQNTSQADVVTSTKCAAITYTRAASNEGVLYQECKLSDGYLLPGRTVSLSVRVKASVAGAARVDIYDGTTAFASAFHSGSGAYETLTATGLISASATNVQIRVHMALSGTFYIDNASLVVGSQPSDYVPLHPADDLARCLRYYENIGSPGANDYLLMGYNGAGATSYFPATYKAVKPVTPTVTKVGTWNVTNCGQPSVGGPSTLGFFISTVITALGAGLVSNATAGNTITVESNP